jgi:type III restriction enzyme
MEEVDKDTHKKAPFLGYEMATGSGKTMLMGASIYFLNKKFGINNFLIITPSSTDIYQKTIRNFTVGGYDSVWADDTPFTFNLITGDNYNQNLFFDKSKDANIFVFNISKFGTNATNTEKTWESAIWQDKGNSISIKQFLKGEKLIIITDEAHHHQSLVAKKIINNFHPNAVLEFTATAIENERGSEKKNQQIVYKYDIRRFLEDGHGKLVRAVALANETKKTKDAILQSEKLKLITLFFIHLLKKKAVLLDPKCRELKPIAFVKVKEDTIYTEKIFNYIKYDLANDLDNINIILEKVKAQDLDITDLLTELFNDNYGGKIDHLQADIQKTAERTIFYYGKSDKETEKKFLNIRRNEVEVVVYMQRLDEGIDLPNIYTMAVINDTESNFQTSVKQIIGRGVRLNKDKREFDDSPMSLIQQSEKLHIVCDQGKSFEDVVMRIQQEFGLNSKYLSFDKPRRVFTNKAKSELLKDKYLPHIKADFKAIEGRNLISLVNDVNTIVENYLEENCFGGKEDNFKRYLKYRPDTFFLEVDVFADKKGFHTQFQQVGGKDTTLVLTEKEIKSIYGIVQKNLHCLPDTDTVKTAFRSYIDKLNSIPLKYYWLDEADTKLAANLFVNSFSFFYRNHIERNYFRLDFKQIVEEDSWNLMQHFRDYELRIPEDQVTDNKRGKVTDKNKLIELIEENYHFSGYKKSIYDFDKFDSYPELQLAEYVDAILKVVPRETKPFWVRNQRNIYFTYGSKKYHPDFILFKDDYIYVIETKGEVFSDNKKNALLKRLDEIPGDGKTKGYKGVLVFSDQLDVMGEEFIDFDDFILESEEVLRRHQSKTELIPDPPEYEKYIKYIPVYSPLNAFKKFIKHQKTPKPDGWFGVEGMENRYPETVFATQVKGNALKPLFKHNDWIILKCIQDATDALNRISMVYCDQIVDEYENGFTIRTLRTFESKSASKLFGDKEVHLIASNSDYKSIIIKNIEFQEGIEIVAVILNSD